MPSIQQRNQASTGGTRYEESQEEREAWRKLRTYIRDEGIKPGEMFLVKGAVAKLRLDGTDDDPRYFTKPVTDNKGEQKDWPYVKAYCAITDPRFGKPGLMSFPPKNVGASFFDGRTKQGRSPNKGGMFNLHYAVTGDEPSQELKDGTGAWDTEDYEDKPILLRLEYQGKEEADSIYADRRAGMKIFVAGFEKDRDVHRQAVTEDDDSDGLADDSPFDPPAPQAQAATEAADLGSQRATERQVKFILALAREAGVTEDELRDRVMGRFFIELEDLTRKQASLLIDDVQRERYDKDPKLAAHPGNVDPRVDGPAVDGKDEVVSVGVGPAKRVAETDDDEF